MIWKSSTMLYVVWLQDMVLMVYVWLQVMVLMVGSGLLLVTGLYVVLYWYLGNKQPAVWHMTQQPAVWHVYRALESFSLLTKDVDMVFLLLFLKVATLLTVELWTNGWMAGTQWHWLFIWKKMCCPPMPLWGTISWLTCNITWVMPAVTVLDGY